MEKDNKYYSLIESLIKKHKKFPGYEDILEDIIDDVYSHSEVIIGSINNESVINAYLEKVISTSLITVPKRLNFYPKAAERRARPELVDRMINSSFIQEPKEDDSLENLTDLSVEETIPVSADIPTSPAASVNYTLTLEEETPETAPPIEEDNTDLNDYTLTLEEEAPQEDAPIIEENTDLNDYTLTLEEEAPQEDSSIAEENADLNDFTPDLEDEKPQEDITPAVAEDELSDSSIAIEDFNTEEPASLEEASTPEEFDLSPEEDNNSELISDREEEISLDESSTDSEILPEYEELPEELEDLDSNETELSSDLSLEVQEPPIEEYNNLDLTASADELIPEYDNSLSLDLDNNTVEELDSLTAEDSELQAEPENHEDFVPTDYSKFNIKIDSNEEDYSYDAQEISEEISSLAGKRPELNISKVYELKYKENQSVSQIAQQLEMAENDVIEALCEIVALV